MGAPLVLLSLESIKTCCDGENEKSLEKMYRATEKQKMDEPCKNVNGLCEKMTGNVCTACEWLVV